MSSYRTGRSLGRTIYRDNFLIGIMDDPADAGLVVELLNTRERVLAVQGTSDRSPRKEQLVGVDPLQRDMSVPQTCQDSEGNPVDSPDCEVLGPHYVTTLGIPHGRISTPPSPTPVTCGRVGLHTCGITGLYQSHDSGTPLPDVLPSGQPS